MMKPPLHWRFALWNLILVGMAFALFGTGSRVLLYSAIVVMVTLGFVWRTRSQLTRSLLDLTESMRRSDPEGESAPLIPRGLPETRNLIAAVGEWRRDLELRVDRLSEAHLGLESVVRAMDEGVLVFDDAGRIIRSNAAFARLLDVQSDPEGMTCIDIFRSERLDHAVRNVLRGDEVDAVEFETGSNRILRALLSPVRREGGGQVEAAVMVLEDLTEIRRVDRVRRDFVANVSHEFKTPLTSIRGYAETLITESQAAPHREFAETIRRNALYLESLVNDLLVLARIEAEPSCVLEEVDVRTLVEERLSLRRSSPDSSELEIEVESPSMIALADPARLGIALSNLIDNAIRYNRPEGVVRVVGHSDGTQVVLEVSDQGYGIPQDELPRIFERFYRVDKARTRDAGGTGLGLAIARHAVESQGGTLTATSQAGVGSTFRVSLPCRPARTLLGPA